MSKNNSYTIKLFMPDGNPNSIKIIEKMNWTGKGLEISRENWQEHKKREELNQAGIYLLIGYEEDSDLPKVYIGQGDGIRKRIDSHYKNKLFWDKVLVFVSSNEGLNRAHITWLEWKLIEIAQLRKRCDLENLNSPNEPKLTESEKADTTEFLNEMLSIFPLVEIKIFDHAAKINVTDNKPTSSKRVLDTIVVPAQEDGFNKVFLGENKWYAIRIGGGKLKEIKYIAAYQTSPISAITHYAEVESIEAYGDGGKYQLNFKNPATAIEPIELGNAHKGTMQSTRYTSFKKLLNSKNIELLFH